MPSDNHALVNGRVTKIAFRRLGQNRISHTSLQLLVPADGEQPPATVHAVFFGRTAETAYETLETDSFVHINGWLQSRRLVSGETVLDLVGEKFRVLTSAEGSNQVILCGKVVQPPYFGHPQGHPYLRVLLQVERDAFPKRGKDKSDLIRVTMRDELATRALRQVRVRDMVCLTGFLRSRWRKGSPHREVQATNVQVFSLLPHRRRADGDHPAPLA